MSHLRPEFGVRTDWRGPKTRAAGVRQKGRPHLKATLSHSQVVTALYQMHPITTSDDYQPSIQGWVSQVTSCTLKPMGRSLAKGNCYVGSFNPGEYTGLARRSKPPKATRWHAPELRTSAETSHTFPAWTEIGGGAQHEFRGGQI